MRRALLACGTMLALAACGDPLSEVDRVSDGTADLPVASDSRAMRAAPEQDGTGLFSGLFRPGASQQNAGQSASTSSEPETTRAPADRRGLFGLFGAATQTDVPSDVEDTSEAPQTGFLSGIFGAPRTPSDTHLQVASLPQDMPPPPRRIRPPRNAPDQPLVLPGTSLPFGAVARVCDISMRQMGTRIERAGRGGSRFALYDSDAGSKAPRSFYVTGFADGCARTFTAALAMFGDPALHEQLRYGRPADIHPYSTTDRAYERVKSAICAVPRRKPCGARIDALSRNTVFVSTYERFTHNGRWADMLLHDGYVMAAAIKEM